MRFFPVLCTLEVSLGELLCDHCALDAVSLIQDTHKMQVGYDADFQKQSDVLNIHEIADFDDDESQEIVDPDDDESQEIVDDDIDDDESQEIVDPDDDIDDDESQEIVDPDDDIDEDESQEIVDPDDDIDDDESQEIVDPDDDIDDDESQEIVDPDDDIDDDESHEIVDPDDDIDDDESQEIADMEQNLLQDRKAKYEAALVQRHFVGKVGGVNCGGHMASACAACPGAEVVSPWSSCNGDCKWRTDDGAGSCIKLDDMKLEGRLLVATEGGVIHRLNSDGSDERPFITSNTPCSFWAGTETQASADALTAKPGGVAIDEAAGLIFWTDWLGGTRVQPVDSATDAHGRSELRWSFNASILSSPLNGTMIVPVATSGEVIQDPSFDPILWEPQRELRWPYFISLDRQNQMIYWTDRLDFKIQRCDYQGNSFDIDFHTTKREPMGLVVDSAGQRVYFSSFNEISYVNIEGADYGVLAKSVGQVKGMDYDPVQNYLYFASSGTTRNPSGILRVKGFDPERTKADRCGIGRRGRPYDSSSTCEHVVYLPREVLKDDVSSPIDVKGDFENGMLYWSGKEKEKWPGTGLGGRVYRTNLCVGMPTQSAEQSNNDGQARGDFTVLQEFGTPGSTNPPYVEGIAIFSGGVDYTHSVPPQSCSRSTTGFEVPPVSETAETVCVENYEWRSSTGSSCMEHAAKLYCEHGSGPGSGWSSGWGTFDDYTGTGGKSADQACCACGSPSDRTRTQ